MYCMPMMQVYPPPGAMPHQAMDQQQAKTVVIEKEKDSGIAKTLMLGFLPAFAANMASNWCCADDPAADPTAGGTLTGGAQTGGTQTGGA